MTTKQITAAAAALLLLCSAPVLWQEHAIAKSRADLATVSVPQSAPPEISAPILTAEQNAKVIALLQSLAQPDAGPLDLKAVVAVAAKRAMGYGEEMPRYQQMQKLSMAELQSYFSQAAELPDGDRERTQLLLISLIAVKDPQAALKAALPLCRTVGDDFYDQAPNTILNEIASLYGLWMKQDWRAALSSYETLRAQGGCAGRGIRQDGETLAVSITTLCYAYSPEEARRLFSTLNSFSRVNSLQQIALQARPEDRAFVLAEAERLESEMPGESLRWRMISALTRGEASRSGPEAGMKLLNELHAAGAERERAIAAILHTTLKGPLHEGCLEALAWAKANLPPEEAALAGARFLGGTGDQNTRNKSFRAFDWGEYRDEAIALTLTTESHSNDPGEAIALAREITEHALKVQTMKQVAANTPTFRRGLGFLLQIQSDKSLSQEERISILSTPRQP